eukprot:scaffold2516_cov108-Isochrysis_galbana.AAC.14
MHCTWYIPIPIPAVYRRYQIHTTEGHNCTLLTFDTGDCSPIPIERKRKRGPGSTTMRHAQRYRPNISRVTAARSFLCTRVDSGHSTKKYKMPTPKVCW